MPTIEIKIIPEMVIFGRPAAIEIFVSGIRFSRIVASIGSQQGADGGSYPCVVLQEEPTNQPAG